MSRLCAIPPQPPPLPVLNINLIAELSTRASHRHTGQRMCPEQPLSISVCAPSHSFSASSPWPSSDAHSLTPLGAALKEASWEAEVEKRAETIAKGLGCKKTCFDPRPAAKCAAGFQCRASSRSPQPTQPGQPQPQGYTHTQPQSSPLRFGLKSVIQCNYYCYCKLAYHLATLQSIQQRGEQCSLTASTLQSLWKRWYKVSSFLMHLKSYFLPVTKETISNEALQSVAVWRKPEPLREQVCVNSNYLLKATLPCTQKWIQMRYTHLKMCNGCIASLLHAVHCAKISGCMFCAAGCKSCLTEENTFD